MRVIEQSDKKEDIIGKKVNSWNYWKLTIENGRQRWVFCPPSEDKVLPPDFYEEMSEDFIFDKRKNPNSSDQVLRYIKRNKKNDPAKFVLSSLSYPNSLSRTASESANKCIRSLEILQESDGHWSGDYGGPHFLLPGLIFASYITNTPFPEEKSVLMKRYMLNHQNLDGGWGLHIEGNSTIFGTVMQYCALRLLGMNLKAPELKKAQEWILVNGGATNIPSWGKVFLALLGVYEWQGCNSLMPELWLLPKWLSIHPGRYWCHARMVYLPMSYCFGNKVHGEISPSILSIRNEIYSEDYDKIKWSSHRNKTAEADVFKSTSRGLKALLGVLNWFEKKPLKSFRRKALCFVLNYIEAEDAQTNHIDIGPVNQILNSICIWNAYGKESGKFQQHVDRWDDYLWIAEDGMKMNGYNGSQLWDTAFTIQAIAENEYDRNSESMLSKAYSYIDDCQIVEEIAHREKYFRHASVGGWPFSTKQHGWPISDCTAEGLKTVLKLHRQCIFSSKNNEIISDKRLKQSVDLILSWQNVDGGWATYENQRAGGWLESLNPSEIFGEIMVDYSWTECSSACITALVEFRKDYPDYRAMEISISIKKGIDFIIHQQRDDGSWMGSWGVCFTYGTWFGMEALAAARDLLNENKSIKKACEFLVSKQNNDGGWGESYLSCIEKEYVDHHKSQVINTSWAILGLMAVNYPDKRIIDQGIKYLLKCQGDDGEWPQESISGVFNKTCMITYSSYRNVFPLWALGRYVNLYSRNLR